MKILVVHYSYGDEAKVIDGERHFKAVIGGLKGKHSRLQRKIDARPEWKSLEREQPKGWTLYDAGLAPVVNEGQF